MRTAKLRITWLTSSMMLGLAIGPTQAAPNGPNVTPNIVMPNVPAPGIAPIRPNISVRVPTHVYDDTPHERKVHRKVRRSLKETGATTTEHKVHRRKARRTVKLPAQALRAARPPQNGLAPKHTQPAHVGEPVRETGQDKRGLTAPGSATIVPLPAVHPLPNADLVNNANQSREGQTIRDAGDALRNNGVVTPGNSASGGSLASDPLHNSDASNAAQAAAVLAKVNAIRARFGMQPIGANDSMRYLSGIPHNSGETPADPFGIDPSSAPRGVSAAEDGGVNPREYWIRADGSWSVSHTDSDGFSTIESHSPDGTIEFTTVSPGGSSSVEVDRPGGTSLVTNTPVNGNTVSHTTVGSDGTTISDDDGRVFSIITPEGEDLVRSGNTNPGSTSGGSGSQGGSAGGQGGASGAGSGATAGGSGAQGGSSGQSGGSGGQSGGDTAGSGGGPTRLPTAEGGGPEAARAAAAWMRWFCGTNGWGCVGPVSIEQVRAGGSRGRPSGDDNASNSHGTGPTIDARHSIAVNPDTNATGGGGTPTSARTFDGGKLVNPGPEPAPSVVPPR